MSLIDTFDKDGIEIIDPYKVIRRIDDFPETVIAVFTEEFADLALNTLKSEQISHMDCGITVPVYKIWHDGKPLGLYNTLLGGAASAALLEEIFAKGAKRVLMFGSCGCLNKNIASGHMIVPTAAYRDEGTSYHYAEAGDFIEVKTADKLAEIFAEMNIPYIKTKTWTTDSFYRETKTNMELRKKDGCAVVDMECASVMAVGQFRGKEVYEFLYAADCLDNSSWDKRILGEMPDDMRGQILKIALETAVRLD